MNNLPKIYATCKAGCLWETVHRSELEKIASIVKVLPNEGGAYTLDIGKKYKIKANDGSAWGGLSIILECTYSEGKKTVAVELPEQHLFVKDLTFGVLGFLGERIEWYMNGNVISYTAINGTWLFNQDMTLNLGFRLDINFACDGENYVAIKVGENDGHRVLYYVTSANTVAIAWEEGFGWGDTAYRTVDFGSTLQEVSCESYEGFAANATKVGGSTLLAVVPIVANAEAVYFYNEDATLEGKEGASAYEVAVANGFEGTEEEWLESLRGGEHLNPANIQGAVRTGANLFNKYAITKGYYLDTTNGELNESTNHFVSEFIEIEPNTNYCTLYGSRYVWYDEYKNYISGGNNYNFGISPSNAKYLRYDNGLSFVDIVTIVKGTVCTGDEKFILSLEWLKEQNSLVTPENISGAYFQNMFDKSKAIDGSYVESTDGSFNANSNYFRTDYLQIKPNTTYRKSGSNRYAFYDENKAYISGGNSQTVFTSPENAKYLVTCGTPISQKDTFILAEQEHYPETYAPYSLIIPWLLASAPKSKYEGKTLVCFGDSITNMGYTDAIISDTGINAINVGMSSARYAYSDDSNEYVNAFALHNIIDSLVSGEWTIPNKIIGVSGYETQADKLAVLKTIDFNAVDFVSFAYGTNDYASATPLTNTENLYDKNTVTGALRYAIKTLLTKYPHLRIIVSLPIYRFFTSNGTITSDGDTQNYGGGTLKEYCEAIKEAVTAEHIPYVDLYNNGGINAYNRLNYFNITDGTHPTEKGLSVIGHQIASGVLAYL